MNHKTNSPQVILLQDCLASASDHQHPLDPENQRNIF